VVVFCLVDVVVVVKSLFNTAYCILSYFWLLLVFVCLFGC
jgi:hypothetical protein